MDPYLQKFHLLNSQDSTIRAFQKAIAAVPTSVTLSNPRLQVSGNQRQLLFNFEGGSAFTYKVLATENLPATQWSPASGALLQNAGSTYSVVIPINTSDPRKFFRVTTE